MSTPLKNISVKENSMRNRGILHVFFIGCCLILLTACGGGGSATSHPSASASPTGSMRAVKVTITDTTITSSQTSFTANGSL